MKNTNFKFVIFFVFSISSSLYACAVVQDFPEVTSQTQNDRIVKILTAKILQNGQSDVAVYQKNQHLCQRDMRYVVGLLSFFASCTNHASDSARRISLLGCTTVLIAMLTYQINYLKSAKRSEENVIANCAEKLSLDSIRAIDADENIKKSMRIQNHFIERVLNYQYRQGKNVLDAIGALSHANGRSNTQIALTLGQLLAEEKGLLEACNEDRA